MTVNKLLVALAISMLFGSGTVFAYEETNPVWLASEAGDVEAVRALANAGAEDGALAMAFIYDLGESGVEKNPKLAAEWYLKAAKQGDFYAQFILSKLYIDGEDVLADYRSAYMWLNLASYNLVQSEDTGDYIRTDIKERKKTLFFLMTRDDISEAQRMASRCLESDYKYCGVTEKEAEKLAEAEQVAEVIQAIESMIADEGTSTYSPDSVQIAAAVNYMKDEIIKTWTRPANARNGMVVELVIHLVPTGEVVDVEVSYRDPSATDAFVASVVNAVKTVRRLDELSQLSSELFDANFRRFTIRFKPEDLRL